MVLIMRLLPWWFVLVALIIMVPLCLSNHDNNIISVIQDFISPEEIQFYLHQIELQKLSANNNNNDNGGSTRRTKGTPTRQRFRTYMSANLHDRLRRALDAQEVFVSSSQLSQSSSSSMSHNTAWLVPNNNNDDQSHANATTTTTTSSSHCPMENGKQTTEVVPSFITLISGSTNKHRDQYFYYYDSAADKNDTQLLSLLLRNNNNSNNNKSHSTSFDSGKTTYTPTTPVNVNGAVGFVCLENPIPDARFVVGNNPNMEKKQPMHRGQLIIFDGGSTDHCISFSSHRHETIHSGIDYKNTDKTIALLGPFSIMDGYQLGLVGTLPELTGDVVHFSCNGLSDGSVQNVVCTNCGSEPYNYTWSTGQNTANLSGLLTAGNYTLKVTPANDDAFPTTSQTFVISEPEPLVITIDDMTHVSFLGGSDGAIHATVTSGSATPLNFSWSNGATTEDIDRLTAGVYTVTVVDAVGCTATSSATIQDGTAWPTSSPSDEPTSNPTVSPTSPPTYAPTGAPSPLPTHAPTGAPTSSPTRVPTIAPTAWPTLKPTKSPTFLPTTSPTVQPSLRPTAMPTNVPTVIPTNSPSSSPTQEVLTFTISQGGTLLFFLSTGIIDLDPDLVGRQTIITIPRQGTYSVEGNDGLVSFVPNLNIRGVSTITVAIVDSMNVQLSTTVVQVTVVPTVDPTMPPAGEADSCDSCDCSFFLPI